MKMKSIETLSAIFHFLKLIRTLFLAIFGLLEGCPANWAFVNLKEAVITDQLTVVVGAAKLRIELIKVNCVVADAAGWFGSLSCLNWSLGNGGISLVCLSVRV
jgi:hypothetical protein